MLDEAFYMRKEGMTYKDIAKTLGVSYSEVRNHILKILIKERYNIEDAGGTQRGNKAAV